MANASLQAEKKPLGVEEASAVYQVADDGSPKVPPGYKQTGVGVIPEEWSVRKLGDISGMKSGEGITSANIDEHSVFPCYGGNGLRGYTTRFTHDGSYALIGRQGALCGNVVGVQGKFFASEHAVVVTPTSSTDIVWLTIVLGDMKLNQYSESSAQPGLSVAKILELPVPLPSLPEQRAIAAALSDVDALLAKLDALIAKKRDLKQAAMQQLLTGKTRLPGFSGEWEVVKAGDIGRFRGGCGFPIKYQGMKSGEYPLFKVSDMNNPGNETFMETANNYISEALRKQLGATVFPAESIVFAKVGAAVFLERKKILRTASCLDNNMAAFVMDANRAYYRFVHYILLNTNLGSLVSTTALPSLSGNVLSAIELPLPPLPEQTAIATLLSDMDAEITALEARRDKTQALKQGMMQELLTGRIRLV